jgi:hypothetical protein
MRGRIVVTAVVAAFALVMCGATLNTSSGSVVPSFGTVDTANATEVAKSTAGGSGENGDANAAGKRFGTWLSNNATPVLIAFAGCALVSVLFSRNIGAGVGIVLITLMSLMFLMAPGSIAAFAKGVAGIIF